MGPGTSRTLEDSSNRTGFRTESASSVTAGRYQCAYYTKRNGWSEQSDLLPLVVTGFFRAPSLSAHPSPVVASGRNVFLLCSSESTSGTFHLLKERGADPPQHMESKWWPDTRRWQALFPMGPTNTSHGGTYRCYGSQSSYVYQWSWPSDPLRLEVTGVYKEPSLSAQPGMLVLSGELLSLQCHSEAGFDRFALTKDEGLTPPQCLDGQHSPNFPLGPVTRSLAGQYRCYSGHNLSYAWSAPSAPLDILVTGMYKKPSLSAQPGPSVPWGGKVTLQCHSQTLSDTFYLHKEGSPAPPQHFRPPDTAASFQANFTMNPVTSAHGGTYRCYSSWSTSPYLLSHPSDPVEFVVSGLKRYLNILIGVLVALVLLFSLLLFLLLRHWRQRKCRMSMAASEPEDRGLQKSSGPAADDQENLCKGARGGCPGGEDMGPENVGGPQKPRVVQHDSGVRGDSRDLILCDPGHTTDPLWASVGEISGNLSKRQKPSSVPTRCCCERHT
ncbi:leukocyte immunoglobulin-like receptor subfamily B member 3 isoform X13 [Rousettus aegyptiacus]|uniref:leukocyte immunoglobulin-like receptor subfamily B member 3 isoform X13 n=1 Tax=Rousettus aegyptiacus TaxID=9407 RepID=UPI00168D3C8D|nr:leukocyte immunoglobulin-like receptor subfamily B member 3 isoform X13 [Rousettus aegyptiacus]